MKPDLEMLAGIFMFILIAIALSLLFTVVTRDPDNKCEWEDTQVLCNQIKECK